MMDDIVTRLRENCETTDCVNVRSIALVKCDSCKAADEITLLRKLVELFTPEWMVRDDQLEEFIVKCKLR